jgi:uncharacterized protein (TIGR02246 family)
MASDEQEIRQLIEKWMSATKAGDIETVVSLMTDDVKFLVAGRAPFGKEEFREQSKDQAAADVHFDGTSEVLEINVAGEWAFAITRLSVTGAQPDKPPMTRSGHTLTIFKKENGRWLLARDANLLSK